MKFFITSGPDLTYKGEPDQNLHYLLVCQQISTPNTNIQEEELSVTSMSMSTLAFHLGLKCLCDRQGTVRQAYLYLDKSYRHIAGI